MVHRRTRPSGTRRARVVKRLPYHLAALLLLVSFLSPAPAAGENGPAPSAPPLTAEAGPEAAGLTRRAFLPILGNVRPYECPASSTSSYNSIPYEGQPSDRPPAHHADLNLSMRAYAPVQVPLQLVDYGGSTDPGARPQMRDLFADGRTPQFVAAYQVYSWDWSCGLDGCRGPLLADWPVTLLGMRTRPGEAVRPPGRASEIYAGGYVALVLYAEPNRITLKYTREDNVVSGYTVHIENVCVDPNLLSLYNTLNAAGRPQLPALRNGEALGAARAAEIAVAIRDCGGFMDPRSRKDWWQ